VAVDQLFSDDYEVTSVGPGENVKIKLKVSSGYNKIMNYLTRTINRLNRVSRRRTYRLVLCSVMPPIQ